MGGIAASGYPTIKVHGCPKYTAVNSSLLC